MIFKRIISGLISSAIIVNTPVALADNKYEQQADLSIAEDIKNADSFATSLVMNDLTSTFNKVLQVNGEAIKINKEAVVAHEKQLKELKEQFRALGELDAEKIVENESLLKDLFGQYNDLMHKFFDLSWVPADNQTIVQNSPFILRDFIDSFTNVCKKGRSSVSFNYKLPMAPPPEPHYTRFVINVGEMPSVDYESYNYADDSEIKAWTTVAEVAGLAASIAGSIVINSALAGAAISTAAAATAGIGAAVMIIAIAVIDISAKRKARQEKSKWVFAQVRMNNAKKTSKYISERYVEICKDTLGFLNQMSSSVELFTQRGESPAKTELIKEINDQKQFLKEYSEHYKKVGEASCRSSIFERRKNDNINRSKKDYEPFCITEEAVKAIKSDKERQDQAGKCVVDENRLYSLTFKKSEKEGVEWEPAEKCSLTKEDGEGFKLSEEDDKILNDFRENQDEFEKYVYYSALSVLAANQENLSKMVSSQIHLSLKEEQQKAFNRLIRLFSHLRKAKKSGLVAELKTELAIDKQLNQFRKTYLEIVGLTIKSIFGQNGDIDPGQELEKVKGPWKQFAVDYSHVKEVRQLHNAFRDLDKVIGQ